MSTPDYPALSAKLSEQSAIMCKKCGLTVLQRPERAKPCLDNCPARTLLRNAQLILRDFVHM